MRGAIILIMLLGAASATVAQANHKPTANLRVGPQTAAPCRGADLSVRLVNDDQAMGGQHLGDFAFRNNSAAACTLKGYPRFELLNKAGALMPRGRAVNSKQLPGDETASEPAAITIQSGKEAVFRIHYNSGGAGYLGKPCPTSRKVRIAAPGTTRSFILKQEITSCGKVEISAMRVSTGAD